MILKAPSSLEWYDVGKVLTYIFDFKLVKREGMYFYMRRGNLHLIMKPGEGCVEVHFHEDVGRGPHHKVLRESKKLSKFREELQTALKNWEELRKPRSVNIFEEANVCPLYQVCPHFREDSYLCTYQFSNRRYCQEYGRLKRRIRGQ